MAAPASTVAGRAITVGVALLLAALVSAVAAMHSVPFNETVIREHRLPGAGRPLVVMLAGELPQDLIEDIDNMTVVVSNRLPYPVNVTVAYPGPGSAVLVEPGSTASLHRVSPLSTLLLRPLGGEGAGCCIELRYIIEGRRYPYQVLSIPSFILMLAGSAVLGFGAVLRLSGIEEA